MFHSIREWKLEPWKCKELDISPPKPPRYIKKCWLAKLSQLRACSAREDGFAEESTLMQHVTPCWLCPLAIFYLAAYGFGWWLVLMKMFTLPNTIVLFKEIIYVIFFLLYSLSTEINEQLNLYPVNECCSIFLLNHPVKGCQEQIQIFFFYFFLLERKTLIKWGTG